MNLGPGIIAASSWQRELSEAVQDPVELLQLLGLTPAQLQPPESEQSLRAAVQGFALKVPRSFVARMRPADPSDPLLRQVLGLGAELANIQGFSADPLDEVASLSAPALLQKYAGRALLITTGACAIHCRYCFRRNFDYAQHTQARDQARWHAAIQQLAKDQSIHEVLLSGGDPLSLSNARLESLIGAIAGIKHLRRLRIHTRTAVVLPSRIDDGLLKVLRKTPLQVVVVVHVNHAAEIDASALTALQRLHENCHALLNQAVLLAGVNDTTEALQDLSLRLFDAGVLPYYLHQLDRVSGAAHFDVPEARAARLLGELRARLPGYLVPTWVREEPGAASKTPLNSDYC
jgi:L-lysine 2,3-aminomutase